MDDAGGEAENPSGFEAAASKWTGLFACVCLETKGRHVSSVLKSSSLAFGAKDSIWVPEKRRRWPPKSQPHKKQLFRQSKTGRPTLP